MFNQSTLKWFLRGLAVTLLLLLVSLAAIKVPGVLAQPAELQPEAAVAEGSIQEYVSPLVIPAADFRNDGYDQDAFMFWFGWGGAGGFIEGDNTAGSACVMAPAYLPSGASVFQFWVSVVDNDATYDMYIDLYRVHHYPDGVVDLMGSISTSGASPNIQSLGDNSIANPVISYEYAYYVTTCLQNSNTELWECLTYRT